MFCVSRLCDAAGTLDSCRSASTPILGVLLDLPGFWMGFEGDALFVPADGLGLFDERGDHPCERANLGCQGVSPFQRTGSDVWQQEPYGQCSNCGYQGANKKSA